MKIHDLSLSERLKLVEDIWDSIADEQEVLPLTPEQRKELDDRLKAYQLSGDPGTPALEVITEIRNRL
ncbi:addiction module protein [Desulfobacterota bacterium AH_259_B03_O07]|nr:addiction module protein [Desulfobacterota bacterium AH_259_B03_O07]